MATTAGLETGWSRAPPWDCSLTPPRLCFSCPEPGAGWGLPPHSPPMLPGSPARCPASQPCRRSRFPLPAWLPTPLQHLPLPPPLSLDLQPLSPLLPDPPALPLTGREDWDSGWCLARETIPRGHTPTRKGCPVQRAHQPGDIPVRSHRCLCRTFQPCVPPCLLLASPSFVQ